MEEPSAAPPSATVSAQSQGNGIGMAGFITGLLGLILSIIPFLFYIGIVLDVLGIVFGAIGRSKAKRPGVPHGGLATAGLVMGIIGMAIFILWIVLIAAAVADA